MTKVSTFKGGDTPETRHICVHCGRRWSEHSTLDYDLVNVCPTNIVRTLGEGDRITP